MTKGLADTCWLSIGKLGLHEGILSQFQNTWEDWDEIGVLMGEATVHRTESELT